MFFPRNPQIIHIICEIVIFFTLIFWILSTRKKLSLQVERLLVRLEEQEEKMQRMELILEQIHMDNMSLNQQIQKMKEENLMNINLLPEIKNKSEVRKPEVRKQKVKPNPVELPKFPILSNIPDINSLFPGPLNIPVFIPNKVNTSSVTIKEKDDSDSDLDEELKEELEELKDELLKFEKTQELEPNESLSSVPTDLNSNTSPPVSPNKNHTLDVDPAVHQVRK